MHGISLASTLPWVLTWSVQVSSDSNTNLFGFRQNSEDKILEKKIFYLKYVTRTSQTNMHIYTNADRHMPRHSSQYYIARKRSHAHTHKFHSIRLARLGSRVETRPHASGAP